LALVPRWHEGAYMSNILEKNGEDRGARPRNRKILANALAKASEESLSVFCVRTMAEADQRRRPTEKSQLAQVAIVHLFKCRILSMM